MRVTPRSPSLATIDTVASPADTAIRVSTLPSSVAATMFGAEEETENAASAPNPLKNAPTSMVVDSPSGKISTCGGRLVTLGSSSTLDSSSTPDPVSTPQST